MKICQDLNMKLLKPTSTYSPVKKFISRSLIAILISGQLFAQCPPAINAGLNATILCGGDVVLGQIPTTTTSTLSPGCTNPAQLTQAGGSYINSVSTTGGSTNISNLNTLVDGGNPSSSYVAPARWYSNYTSQFVETTAGSAFNVIIQGAAVTNLPTFYRIWIDE